MGVPPGIGLYPQFDQTFTIVLRVVAKPAHEFGVLLEVADRGQRAARRMAGQGVGEQLCPRSLDEVVDDGLGTRREPARHAPERLPERRRDDVDLAVHSVVFRRPAPGVSQHARRVRVVDRHDRVVPVAQLADLRERRDLPLHREDAVGDDEPVSRVPGRLQCLAQRVHVHVVVDQPAGLAETDPVDDAGVIETVRDQRVLRTEERCEQTLVRVPRRRIGERGRSLEEVGDLCLELAVNVERTTDETYR